jgi:hypothetical protein
MKTIKDDKDRSIHIFDNAISQADHEIFYTFVMKSLFQIGFEDINAIEIANYKYLHSSYTIQDLEHSGFYMALQKSEAWHLIKDKNISRITINLGVPTDTNWHHTHKGQISLVYYINLQWRPEWAAETLFYNESTTEIIHASMYVPRKLIIFDGEIPHSVRVQSNSAPHYRFTLAMFFDKGQTK